VEGDG